MKTKTQKNNPKKEKKNPTLGLEPPIRATFRQGSKAKLRSNSGGPTQGLKRLQDQAKVQFRGPTQGLKRLQDQAKVQFRGSYSRTQKASNESKWVPRDLDPGPKKAQFLGPWEGVVGKQKGSPLECAHKAHKFAVQLQCKREREREKERKEREKNESVVFLFPIQRDLDEVPTFACNNFATDKLNCITTVAAVADELVNVVPLAQLLPSSLPFPSLFFFWPFFFVLLLFFIWFPPPLLLLLLLLLFWWRC